MARSAQPIRKIAAIYVKTRLNGADVYIREPYNIVALDWSDGQAPKTYLEPCGVLLRQPSPDDSASRADTSTRTDIYDEIRVYDRPPFPHSRAGVLVI